MKQKPKAIAMVALKYCICKVVGLLPVRLRPYTAIQLKHLANIVENMNAPSI